MQSNKLNDWDSKNKYIKNNIDIAKENSENAHRDFLNNFTWKKIRKNYRANLK